MEREPERPDQELHEELEGDAEDLEARAQEVGEHIDETRSDWEASKQDSSVPGAQPDDDEPPASGASRAEGPGGPV